MLIVTNYHYVRPTFDAPFPGIHGETPSRLVDQLERLAELGTFVSLEDVRAAAHGVRPLPDRSILVSFDDGLREQFDHAWPVLRRMGIPSAFFVNTAPIADGRVSVVHKIHLLRAHVPPADFRERLRSAAAAADIRMPAEVTAEVAMAHYQFDTPDAAKLKFLLNFRLPRADRDRLVETVFGEVFRGREAELSRELYMDREQIEVLGQAGCIGTHAHEHVPLGLMDAPQVRRQVATSLDILEAWIGSRPFAMSYPYGSKEASSAAAGAVAADLGIEIAFTIERAANMELSRPLHLARFNCNHLPGGKADIFGEADPFRTAALARWFAP